jgi:ketosteroid isomerase-like protein
MRTAGVQRRRAALDACAVSDSLGAVRPSPRKADTGAVCRLPGRFPDVGFAPLFAGHREERSFMGEQSVEVVRAAYDALGRGDLAGVLGAMADDIEWHQAEGGPYGGVYHGGEAVAQNVFGPLMRDIPNFALAPEEYIASGDTVAVVVRYTGTGTNTGKELDLPVVHVWDVRGGKLAQFRQFMDTAKFREVVAAG